MQRAELEELRHREANNTALQAIGPRKRKLDSDTATSAVSFSIHSLKKIFFFYQQFSTFYILDWERDEFWFDAHGKVIGCSSTTY
jgi:hypothetical protein